MAAPFPPQEYLRRVELTQARMNEVGLDALFVTDPGKITWLCGYDAWSFYVPQALLLEANGDPVWMGREMDAGAASFTTYLDPQNVVPVPEDHVQHPQRHSGEYMGDRMVERGLKGKRIGYEADGYYLSPRWLMFQPEQVDALVGGLSPEVQALLGDWRAGLNDARQPLLHRMRNLDAETYMPGAVLAKVDRMSMQVALEVRCPLLDRDVAAYAQGLPASACWQPPAETKRLLKALTERYLPRAWLDRPKMGFGLPSNAWSKEAMLDLARELLDSPDSQLAGLLAPGALHGVVEHQAQPGCFSIYQLWPLLILELWLRNAAGLGPVRLDAAR